ncbi:PAS domain S-box protein [Nostoc sp. TCL26-01]|uniref:PAS domain S-box protein n=1 Tax=Nostoc sp. TCL26-01 TaxID=2576904 RepID=UPI00356965B0
MVEPATLLSDAISQMVKQGVDVLLVGSLQTLGWLSEHDVVKLVALGIDLPTTPVSAVMNPIEIKLKLSDLEDISKIVLLSRQYQSNCLLIVDEEDQLVGTVSHKNVCQVIEQITQLNQQIDIDDDCLAPAAMPLTKSELGIEIMELVDHSLIWQHRNRQQLLDMSDRQMTQQQLMLQLILDTIPECICWKDINSVFLGCNLNFARMLGFEHPEEIVGKTDDDLLANYQDADFCRASDARVIKTGTPEYHIIELLLKTNEQQIWLKTNKVPLRDSEGKVIGVLCTLEDVSEQQAALRDRQEALTQSEQRFRNLVEASSDWVWEVDENTIYTYASPQIRDILGYEPQELLGKTPFDFMPPAEAQRVKDIFAPIAAMQQPFKFLESINIHRDGHLVILETSGVPIVDLTGKLCGYRGIDRDITTRKQAEVNLHNTQQQLQAILDNSPTVIFVLDTQNRFVLINQEYEKLINFTQNEIVGKSIYDVWPDDIAKRFALNNHLLMTNGIPTESEEVIPQQDGLHTYLTVKFPLKDVHGVTYAVCGIATDITERKRAEEELRQSEERFRLLIADVKDYAIYMLDPEGRVMSWNSGAECITGYQTTEIIGQDFACFFVPEDIAKALPTQQLEIAAATGRYECESLFVRKDGSHFWANCILTALRDQTSKLRGFAKVTRDITERKMAEDCLLRFQKAIESTSDGVAIEDNQGIGIYVNPAFTELYGYNLEELQAVGGMWVIFHMPDERSQIFTSVLKGESWRGEVTMRSHEGNLLQVDLRVDAIKDTNGKVVGTVCIHTDITQRQQVEEGLRLRDRAIDASSNGIIIADASIPNGPIIYVNPAFERMTGYLAEEVIGQNFRLFQSADIEQPGIQELKLAMQAGKACTVVLRNYRKDGRLLWNELNISPVYDSTGQLTHYIGIQTDITERKQAETALLISQQRLQYLLTSSPAVIYTCKTLGDFGDIFVSDNITTITGYETWEFIQDTNFWSNRIHPEDLSSVLAEFSQVLEKRQYKLEYRFLHKDGTYHWLYDQGRIVEDDTGNPVEMVGYLIDMTERKQLEEELKIALEKEKELSELKSRFVSMTSHEFRTPLSTILSSSELLEHYRHKWTEEKQLIHLHRIQSAVKRMTEMLNDVLVIGKAEAGKLEFIPTSFDLMAYCRHLVGEIQANISNQQLHFISEYKTIPCYMDEKLLGHILHNLLANAIKYSPDDSTIQFTFDCQNEYAIFEIKDQGIGIPPEDIPRLFESFHRAKNVGNIVGTGLGLAIVKKCVDIYQGEISVVSQLGMGTKFTVKLPLNNQI